MSAAAIDQPEEEEKNQHEEESEEQEEHSREQLTKLRRYDSLDIESRRVSNQPLHGSKVRFFTSLYISIF